MMLKESFAINGQAEIAIDVSCNVQIKESDDNRVHVLVEGDDESLEDFEIYQEDPQTVVVRQTPTYTGGSQNVVIGNGMSVTQVNGVTYINNVRAGGGIHIGEVYVNGKRVSGGFNSQDFEKVEPIQVTVYCPSDSTLNLKIGGQATFVSTAHLAEATVDCSGQVEGAIASVGDLEIELAGQSDFRIGNVTGRLAVDVAGQSTVDAKGEFVKVSIDCSGQSKVNTHGVCEGNYIADASGMSRISHYGTVRGRVRKDVSGMATIDV